jgi:hydroxymethylpyrimidine/phosphomethylpyrimidine kinase
MEEKSATGGCGNVRRLPVILTVAGSDSGGGAGIQADIKTFTSLGCHATTVITALTAQNSVGVQAVHEVPSPFVSAQLESVLGDLRPAAAKTGMLSSAPIIDAVASALARLPAGKLVVDPVMVSTSFVSIVEVVTPNIHDAASLFGMMIETLEEVEKAAYDLFDLGPRSVLLKGGHMEGSATDVFFDGKDVELLHAERFETDNTHGSGCVLAGAIASFLGRGLARHEAVREGKSFITAAVGASYRVGEGPGPVDPTRWKCTDPH